MGFEGRTAIVTGAGSEKGIGRATALLLAKKGADVVVADMDLAGAGKVAAEVESLGRKSLALKVNVSDPESVKKMVADTLDKFGRIDILINNAGVTQPVTLLNTTLEDWNRVISINLTGSFLCMQAVLPTMIERGYGRVVSLSSVSGKRGGGVYGGAHYSAAKAGILGLSKAAAREVAENGITINCVAPGLVATDIRKGLPEEKERASWEAIPMKRPGTPQEIAESIVFLASDEAAYITGEEIDINGGSHMD